MSHMMILCARLFGRLDHFGVARDVTFAVRG